ncbi:MAG: peptide ABC transporter permease [Thioclava sp.]|nr:peptide ABC transporter permease [Thioclava sp.]|tara:strand:- start:1175 stop:2041 length:867 start_codon:yes stop_codon:yes gene_type:complete
MIIDADSWKRLKRSKVALVSGALILFLVTVAIFAPLLSPYPFDEQYLDQILTSFSSSHWLGTDNLGRDMLSRLIYGARISMAVAVFTAVIAFFIGILYGSISGWLGGWVDSVMMRSIDILDSVPALVLLILVKVFFDSMNLVDNPELRSLLGMLLALSFVSWVSMARLVRAQVLQMKQMAFVEASRSLGASGARSLMKHVLPNIAGPVMVLLTYQIPSNILFESFLSFLGLGLQPPYASWGVLANDGWRTMRTYPHLMISPGVAIFIAMLSFNLLGDGLRDAIDPKSK